MILECPSCGKVCEHTELPMEEGYGDGNHRVCSGEDCGYEFVEADIMWQWLEQHGLTPEQRSELLDILVVMGYI